MSYTAEHADALADLRESGASVTFTRRTATHDAATDLMTSPTTSSVAGYAIQVATRREEEDTFRANSTLLDRARMLFFAPTTIGEVPRPGDTCTWGSVVYTVAFLGRSVALNATTIAVRVGLAR